jgi:hypothetical protein
VATLFPVLWSRAWRGHLWHARRYVWDLGGEVVSGAAECGFRPTASQGSYAARRGMRWVETTERETRPTHRASNGQWLHDMRCPDCVAATRSEEKTGNV